MTYLKGVIGTLAAILLAVLIPMFWTTFRGMSGEKAIGLSAISAGLFDSVFSPLFWILALLFLGFFFATGRLENKTVRILLFWMPALTT